MSLEPYGPAAALIALAFLTVIAFVWVRALMKRMAPGAKTSMVDVAAVSAPEPVIVATALQPSVPASHAPDYVMVSAVELWFGETRVSVRAGSKTEERFREFGDALLEELVGARTST